MQQLFPSDTNVLPACLQLEREFCQRHCECESMHQSVRQRRPLRASQSLTAPFHAWKEWQFIAVYEATTSNASGRECSAEKLQTRESLALWQKPSRSSKISSSGGGKQQSWAFMKSKSIQNSFCCSSDGSLGSAWSWFDVHLKVVAWENLPSRMAGVAAVVDTELWPLCEIGKTTWDQ